MSPRDYVPLIVVVGLVLLPVLVSVPDWCRALWGWVQKAKRWL